MHRDLEQAFKFIKIDKKLYRIRDNETYLGTSNNHRPCIASLHLSASTTFVNIVEAKTVCDLRKNGSPITASVQFKLNGYYPSAYRFQKTYAHHSDVNSLALGFSYADTGGVIIGDHQFSGLRATDPKKVLLSITAKIYSHKDQMAQYQGP